MQMLAADINFSSHISQSGILYSVNNRKLSAGFAAWSVLDYAPSDLGKAIAKDGLENSLLVRVALQQPAGHEHAMWLGIFAGLRLCTHFLCSI